MKTSKTTASDLSSSRRAQPLRQTRHNPPRSSIPAARAFGSRGSLGGGGGGLDEKDVEIFPAITHFADAITALPKELVRHFTLLKEVDAKIFAPEEQLHNFIQDALEAPLPPRPQPADHAQSALGPTSAPISAPGSASVSVVNGNTSSDLDAYNLPNPLVYDAANFPRRQLFQNCAITMQNMLMALDEKNHVISTASEALNKQLARIDDCFPYLELEISEEARYGSTTHWAYPENRVTKQSSGGSRKEIASVNSLSAAAQHLVDEAAARSDARKQALLERKKGKNQQIDSDFDDQYDGRHKEKRAHGNTKVRKVGDPSTGVGLGITNGANGNPPKRRKVEKETPAITAMERSLSSVLGNNGIPAKSKVASPRGTPGPDGVKKRSRATAGNGQSRKRNTATTSAAMSPSIASSPIRSTFPDVRRISPPPTNGGRPSAARGRQNSTQSVQEKRPPSSASSKPNGTSTPNLEVAAIATGRTIPEVKASMKESAANSKEHLLEDINQSDPDMVGGLLVGNRKDSVAKREESEANGDAIQNTTVTTKSGRASKPSTPAIPSFPEPVRSRSSRNVLEAASNNKRSHKKGAGAAAQLLLAQQSAEVEHTGHEDEDDEEADIDADEPRYCYCNGVSYGEMVGCDANDCEREWFHLECVGLKVAPKGNAKWYCDDCKDKLKNKRFGNR